MAVSTETVLIIAGAAVGGALIVIMIVILIIRRRRTCSRDLPSFNYDNVGFTVDADPVEGLSDNDGGGHLNKPQDHMALWHVMAGKDEPDGPMLELELQDLVTRGHFTEWRNGSARLPPGVGMIKQVLVKIPQDISQTLLAIAEEKAAKQVLNHDHILQLLHKESTEQMLLYEQPEFGNLSSLLMSVWDVNNQSPPEDDTGLQCVDFTLSLLTSFSQDITSGLMYLLNNKMIHPYLSCDNVWVSDLWICKLSGFVSESGAANVLRCYFGQQQMEWMRYQAPETLEKEILSPESNVYSLATLLWQMTSFGQVPHGAADEKSIQQAVCGEQLKQPTFCPNQMYNLMVQCWQREEHLRPRLGTVGKQLMEMWAEYALFHSASGQLDFTYETFLHF